MPVGEVRRVNHISSIACYHLNNFQILNIATLNSSSVFIFGFFFVAFCASFLIFAFLRTKIEQPPRGIFHYTLRKYIYMYWYLPKRMYPPPFDPFFYLYKQHRLHLSFYNACFREIQVHRQILCIIYNNLVLVRLPLGFPHRYTPLLHLIYQIPDLLQVYLIPCFLYLFPELVKRRSDSGESRDL